MASLLVISGGHPYEADAFGEMIAALGARVGIDWEVTHLVHPEAEDAVAEGAADAADALLFYDMPGYVFANGTLATRPPSAAYRGALARRFGAGRGAVAMHHTLAGWARWEQWHQWLGGRFLDQSEQWTGARVPASGYRHEVSYTAQVVAQHPVCDGLPDEFAVCDELYLAQVDERAITPLVRAHGFAFERDNFYSAELAVAGAMFSREGWDHPSGSNCVAWETRALGAPLIYLQFGDGPQSYANQHVRQLLAQALAYTSAGGVSCGAGCGASCATDGAGGAAGSAAGGGPPVSGEQS